VNWLKENGKGPVYDIWQKAGGKKNQAHGPICSVGMPES